MLTCRTIEVIEHRLPIGLASLTREEICDALRYHGIEATIFNPTTQLIQILTKTLEKEAPS